MPMLQLLTNSKSGLSFKSLILFISEVKLEKLPYEYIRWVENKGQVDVANEYGLMFHFGDATYIYIG